MGIAIGKVTFLTIAVLLCLGIPFDVNGQTPGLSSTTLQPMRSVPVPRVRTLQLEPRRVTCPREYSDPIVVVDSIIPSPSSARFVISAMDFAKDGNGHIFYIDHDGYLQQVPSGSWSPPHLSEYGVYLGGPVAFHNRSFYFRGRAEDGLNSLYKRSRDGTVLRIFDAPVEDGFEMEIYDIDVYGRRLYLGVDQAVYGGSIVASIRKYDLLETLTNFDDNDLL